MRVNQVRIQKYRSINDITIDFPENKPVVLFGPNNAGKSNILSAIDRLLGERYPTYIEMLNSDYYMRDGKRYPTTEISAKFSDVICTDRGGGHSTICVRYCFDSRRGENIIHDENGNKLYINNEDRARCQSYLISAERNIQNALNYSSKYTILSKFSHKIHKALSDKHKDELASAFEQIKKSFEETEEFAKFFTTFTEVLQGSVKGFVHSLAVDFSAYDPNNYAKTLRIYAKEGDTIRGFEEFGTGEQQVLLMAFIKAYMEIFTSESFVLIIEEPEAHLHPLAQKWLKEYMVDLCRNGIQVVISTHSPDFIDAEYLEGLVRVYKDNGETKIVQLSKENLFDFCVASGVPNIKNNMDTIDDFYATRLYPDQLKGMFAEKILLVEGPTEIFSIPIYLKQIGFSLAEHGIEIVNCMGKSNIPLLWRLFKAYKYKCYFIFDGDKNKESKNDKIFKDIIINEKWKIAENECVVTDEYAYFGADFEQYFRSEMIDYEDKEKEASEIYHITTKPGKAKAVAQHCNVVPDFLYELKDKLINL